MASDLEITPADVQLATREPKPLVREQFDTEKIELMKRTVAVGATDDEFAMFLHHCRKTGLDPLARQIYFVKRQGKGTIQTGIDGFRVVAERTGVYAGNDEPKYEHIEGMKNPAAATVTVWKVVAGIRCPFTATARWDEYFPGESQGWAWKKMPHVMLAKCAEALALRKAFPADLSGVYAFDELEQANNGSAATLVGACIDCGKEIPADETKCEEHRQAKPIPKKPANIDDKAHAAINQEKEKLIQDLVAALQQLFPGNDVRQVVGQEILGCKTLGEMRKMSINKVKECGEVLVALAEKLKKEPTTNTNDILALVSMIQEDAR